MLFEYPPLPTAGNLIGFVADKRAICFCMRGIRFSNAAEELGAPQIIRFYPMVCEADMPATGVLWQAQNTGDLFVSAAILYGLAAGSQGGAPGTITDNAGLLLTAA
jgi:hypothetical protein